MNYIEPLDLLKNELIKYEKALTKSIISFNKQEISRKLHETHIDNLTPKIQSYRNAIKRIEVFDNLAKHFG